MHKNKDIQNELEAISIAVANIPANEVISVPDGYFELLPISVLIDLQKNNTLEVPPNYFENISSLIIDKIKEPLKIKSLKRVQIIIRFSKAAVLIGLLGFGIYSNINQSYKNENHTINSSAVSKESDTILKNNSFDELLSQINDDDAICFLEENGHDINAALIASLEDENILPSAIDYLGDEQKLNIYLKDLNITKNSIIKN